jgi:hypothetical protein
MDVEIKGKTRLDTKLEAEAAEFFVLAHLLLHRISAYKAYVNFPGYDLIAADAENGKLARLQVKSRYRSDWDGFIIKDCENCDFVIFVALNRGKGGGWRGRDDEEKKAPQFFVLPIAWVREARDENNKWGNITRNRLGGIENFENRWELIADHLAGRPWEANQSAKRAPKEE